MVREDFSEELTFELGSKRELAVLRKSFLGKKKGKSKGFEKEMVWHV